jgi:hypothetical protein
MVQPLPLGLGLPGCGGSGSLRFSGEGLCLPPPGAFRQHGAKPSGGHSRETPVSRTNLFAYH